MTSVLSTSCWDPVELVSLSTVHTHLALDSLMANQHAPLFSLSSIIDRPFHFNTSQQIAQTTTKPACQQDKTRVWERRAGPRGGHARRLIKPLAEHHLGKLEVVDLAVPVYVCLAYDGINLLVRQLLAQIVHDQAELGA